MKSLTVLTIGIKDDNGAALIDLDASKHSSCKKPHTSSVDRNVSFSLGLQRLAQSNIISSRMDMSATLRTNMLSLESEHRGLDMALMDDPPPTEEGKVGGADDSD